MFTICGNVIIERSELVDHHFFVFRASGTSLKKNDSRISENHLRHFLTLERKSQIFNFEYYKQKLFQIKEKKVCYVAKQNC